MKWQEDKNIIDQQYGRKRKNSKIDQEPRGIILKRRRKGKKRVMKIEEREKEC